MALINMIGEISGVLPGLSPILAQNYINYAWTDVRRARMWSFLQTDAAVICPAQIVAGAAAITQFSDQVTLNAAASAALAGQAAATTPPGLTNLQIRFGGGVSNTPVVGHIYSIVAVDVTVPAAIVLTLDRVVQEATSAASSYQVYRCYIVPPFADFHTWQGVTDMVNGWTLRLNYTSTQFNQMDPQRMSQGQAHYLGACRSNAVNAALTGTTPNPNQNAWTPIYELWPHPTSGQTFYVQYYRLGEDLVSPGDALPPMIPEQLVITKALFTYGYPFAQANRANFPTLRSTDFTNLIVNAQRSYAAMILDAMRNDDEQQLTSVFNRGHGLRSSANGAGRNFPFPIDANFLQSHLVNF